MYSYNKDYQTELRIFIRFEVVDTLGSSQVLFWYQDFLSKSNGSQFTGIRDILRRARARARDTSI